MNNKSLDKSFFMTALCMFLVTIAILLGIIVRQDKTIATLTEHNRYVHAQCEFYREVSAVCKDETWKSAGSGNVLK